MLHQAMPRKKPARPIIWLIKNNLINGNILHYGCGKDIPGTQALAKIGTVTEYDPNILEINKIPSQQYDSVVSCFVLNCVHHKEREYTLFNLSNTVTENGSAFIAVRSQKDSNYKVKQKKWWPISDGFTNGKVFQKFYEPEDLLTELKRHFKTAFILYDKEHFTIAQASHTVLPKRSLKYGIGKQMIGCVYVHKSSEQVLPNIKEYIPKNHDYTIVKFNWFNNTFSFIQCHDFDTSFEPTVGNSLIVHADGKTKLIKAPQDPWIYHHKWLMVNDTYKGFNVSLSKARSLRWMKLNPNRSKIGKKSSWMKNVLPLI
jgi:hypothetical protein